MSFIIDVTTNFAGGERRTHWCFRCGVVKLTNGEALHPKLVVRKGCTSRVLGGEPCYYTPGREALGHPLTVHGCSQAVPTGTEVGTNGAVDRKKALRLGGRFEAAHAALPLACWLVGVPRAVIKIAVLAMFYPWEALALGGSVALKFVSNDHARHLPQSPTQLAEELLCCFLIPAALHQDIQHVPVLIYRQPQRVPFSPDRQKYFIHLPLVPKPGTVTPELIGILS